MTTRAECLKRKHEGHGCPPREALLVGALNAALIVAAVASTDTILEYLGIEKSQDARVLTVLAIIVSGLAACHIIMRNGASEIAKRPALA